MQIIKPHNKKARMVKEEDYDKVEDDSLQMIFICKKGFGKYPSAYALAHSQVSDDPLNFFCLEDGRTIINPKIINSTKFLVDHTEGCMSYPDRRMAIVKRSSKCTVQYTELSKNWEIIEKEENLSGMDAFIFQHEIDHLNGIDIYHKDGTRELNDESIGPLSEEIYKNLERKHEV